MVTQLVMNFPPLWIPIVHYRVHNSPILNLALSQKNAVENRTPTRVSNPSKYTDIFGAVYYLQTS
jgi:hypothetical protein